eukprot:scaffold398603_cov14-Prasinocladus_malaysianus.AAC.1
MASGASSFGWVIRASCEEARKAMRRLCCSISGQSVLSRPHQGMAHCQSGSAALAALASKKAFAWVVHVLL